MLKKKCFSIILALLMVCLVGCPPSGPTNVTVPSVSGQLEATAIASLTAAGLTVGTVTEQNHATVGVGRVISQSPAAGTLLPTGSSVNLVISLGPASSLVNVPNVANQTQANATSAITGAGLTVGTVTNEYSGTVAAGYVISQNPAAGTQVSAGTAVSLVVSLGPTPGNGTIQFTISGLPTATPGNVIVTGPNGVTQVTESGGLVVPAGVYTIEPQDVIETHVIAGDLYSATANVSSVTVTTGGTRTVSVSYSNTLDARLLIPNYGANRIEIVDQAKLVSGTGNSVAFGYGEEPGYSGIAFGPDGRLYASSYQTSAIHIFETADAFSGGETSPVILTSDNISGPMGLAFDADGDLWIGDYSHDRVVKFNNPHLITFSVKKAADVVLNVNTSGGANEFSSIYDIFIDHNNDLWVLGNGNDTIYRFENIETYAGVTTKFAALTLVPYEHPENNDYSFAYPMSLVVDNSGRLYIGSDWTHVSRFDNATSLTGNLTNRPASAQIQTGEDNPHMVALDQSGALWIGHSFGDLMRIVNPQNLTGLLEPTPERTMTWTTTGWTDGGRMVFIPNQRTSFGY